MASILQPSHHAMLKSATARYAWHRRCPTLVPRAAQQLSSQPSSDSNTWPHVSVMLNEVLQAFGPVNLKTYVDCTLGAGGHATAVQQQHAELQHLIGIDVDPVAHNIAKQRIQAAQPASLQLSLLMGNYCDVKALLSTLPGVVGAVDGMLMDLGVSSMQLDEAERGFSFMQDGPLDMRMGPSADMSAEELVNTMSEAELGRIIRDWGEEKMWRAVARRIVAAREQQPITSTKQLVEAIGSTVVRGKGGKGGRGGKGGKGIHPATRTFQALRIAVNDEISGLEQAIPDAIQCLAPKGRLAIISFHSLEDRVVKHAFLRAAGRPTPADEHLTYGAAKFDMLDALAASAVGELVTRKPLLPTEEECDGNPRSRSAKLRVFQRL